MGDALANRSDIFGSVANLAFANGNQVRGNIQTNQAVGPLGLPGGIATSGTNAGLAGGTGGPVPTAAAPGGGTFFGQVAQIANAGGLGNVAQHGDGHSVNDMSHLISPDTGFLFGGN